MKRLGTVRSAALPVDTVLNDPTPNPMPSTWTEAVAGKRTVVNVAAHGALFALALLAAFLLAYNFQWNIRRDTYSFTWFDDLYLPLLALALPIKLLAFYWSGQYQGSWRYVGLRDLFNVISASLVATFAFLTVYFLVENFGQQRLGHAIIDSNSPVRTLRQSSVFLLDWACTVGFVCAARILVRFYFEDVQPRRSAVAKRVLIVGAGDSGEACLRELLRSPHERFECVGFLDDSATLHGRIHNVEVLSRTENIRQVCAEHAVQEVFIAMPHASPRFMRQLVEKCEGLGVLFRTIPAVTDVIAGRVQVSQIRDVDIADLLGRAPVQLDTDLIGGQLRGKRALVTGAGGSIGSEICMQIAEFSPQRLILLERSENSLFEIERKLRVAFPALDVTPCVADIIDRTRISQIFANHQPSVVFHAAAHKHVPMMECNVAEAVRNNVLGTMIVANVAIGAGVQTMVMVSTDKAVNPTSVMGCTKRIAEMHVQSLSEQGGTNFITVRFGNVLGSSGSVVPIFQKQIATGGPVTVTHPEMVRYFMTIPEAAQLVLQAGTMGRGGEIYVLHMGEPVKIMDLARDMITLSGMRPGTDIEIAFTGARPGEKLFEELSGEGEDIGDTAHPKIGIWKHRTEDRDALHSGIAQLLTLSDNGAVADILRQMKKLVPEYTPAQLAPSKDAATTAPSPV